MVVFSTVTDFFLGGPTLSVNSRPCGAILSNQSSTKDSAHSTTRIRPKIAFDRGKVLRNHPNPNMSAKPIERMSWKRSGLVRSCLAGWLLGGKRKFRKKSCNLLCSGSHSSGISRAMSFVADEAAAEPNSRGDESVRSSSSSP